MFLRDGGSSGPVSPAETQSGAPTITSGRYGPFTLEEDDSRHYFAVDLNAGDQVEVTMEFSHDEGDLDIDLVDPNEFSLDSSASITDDETVSVTAETGGEHYITPYAYSGAPNSYELDVRIN
ncbi:MAG: bacterial pre-peptidase C-terminal domain protein [halophilic archaeon J07HX64]|nr:MAG: bacterial pre-peptidase C-terminal domain protein [halophilic archaeon J07HX64]